MPIRLWSVVVNQPIRPRGSRSTRFTTIWGTGVRVVAAIAVVLSFSRVLDRGCAGLCRKRLPTGCAAELGGLEVRLERVQPGLELRRRDGRDLALHRCVTAAAEEGALTDVAAWLGDLEPGPVDVARNGLH